MRLRDTARDEQNAEVKLHSSSSAREIGLPGEKRDLQIAALLHGDFV